MKTTSTDQVRLSHVHCLFERARHFEKLRINHHLPRVALIATLDLKDGRCVCGKVTTCLSDFVRIEERIPIHDYEIFDAAVIIVGLQYLV